MQHAIYTLSAWGRSPPLDANYFIITSSEDWPSQWPAEPKVRPQSIKMSGAPGYCKVTRRFSIHLQERIDLI